jgi:hypothetical protein
VVALVRDQSEKVVEAIVMRGLRQQAEIKLLRLV